MNVNSSPSVIYVVDDELAIRDSLTLLLESTGRVVMSFESAEDFLNSVDPEQSGCLILDVRMPLMSGHDLQAELINRGHHIPIIFISGHGEIPDSARAFRAGAVDFIEKPFNNEILFQRIDEALKKDLEFRAKDLERRRIQKRVDHLTPREKEVLELIVSSHSNKESAKILHISNRTVDVHRASIMEKMQAENLAELIAMFLYYQRPHNRLQKEQTG
jgi:FixJ family two-component response regulator